MAPVEGAAAAVLVALAPPPPNILLPESAGVDAPLPPPNKLFPLGTAFVVELLPKIFEPDPANLSIQNDK